jgi:hypothetical protein
MEFVRRIRPPLGGDDAAQRAGTHVFTTCLRFTILQPASGRKDQPGLAGS